ncbi:MAG TPA: hypothetical protein VIL65_05500 [Beijerinckiaceae bacterium]|jgi:hypothetical protein
MPFSRGSNPSSLIVTTAKAALAIGFLSLLAANYLSTHGLDRSELTRMAGDATKLKEPTSTGSLATTRLDPCTGKPARP